jgi:hypothetical protein
MLRKRSEPEGRRPTAAVLPWGSVRAATVVPLPRGFERDPRASGGCAQAYCTVIVPCITRQCPGKVQTYG